MHYTSLNRPALLASGDTVQFSVTSAQSGDEVSMTYLVLTDYLRCQDGGNSAIFHHLGMDSDGKEEFASQAYGYNTYGGDWPTFRDGDYAAATRIVNALFDRANGTVSAAPSFDLAARVPFETMVAEGMKLTLTTVQAADHRITPSEVTSILTRHNIQGFSDEDISGILYKLVEMGILTYAQEADGSEAYFVDPERKAFMQYIQARKNGLPIQVIPREHDLVAPLLKFIREAPASVKLTELQARFGRETELNQVLTNLCERRILKAWEQGYYTRREFRDEVSQILVEAGI